MLACHVEEFFKRLCPHLSITDARVTFGCTCRRLHISTFVKSRVNQIIHDAAITCRENSRFKSQLNRLHKFITISWHSSMSFPATSTWNEPLPFHQAIKHFHNDATNGYNGVDNDCDIPLAELLLQMNTVSGKEFTAREKLEILDLVLNDSKCSTLIKSVEFATLMLELWKQSNRLTREELQQYTGTYRKVFDKYWKNACNAMWDSDGRMYENHLSFELRVLHNHVLCPTLDQYRNKQELINGLRPLLEGATGGILHTFGSCENGLWVRGSDIDLCLRIPSCNTKPQWLAKLNLVKSALVNCEFVSRIQIISQAMVPIAKLFNHQDENVCDVSINNTVALDNTNYVKLMAQLDHRFVKLARFIKYWATCRCINNRAQGSMSSYTLILQLIYLLQNRNPPILPKYKDIESYLDGSSDKVNIDTNDVKAACTYLGHNRESLVQLLFEYFKLYSNKDFQGGYAGSTMDIYNGEIVKNNLGVLVIKCPITGKNVNPFTIAMWQSIYGEFKKAYNVIIARQPLYLLCQVAEEAPMEEYINQYNVNATAMHHMVRCYSQTGKTRLG
ncbi:bifunctional Nucleotidyltransferase superfamily/TUTase nucleotidyltransferase domain [Babesia duncani]|uniref:Bifunctional Nucleotidyltransferase superfamily/TUTase nucleotidyltransferase domain n=1 Tax=Babesia duncani TaxID=323732 RepID=A0AAD9PI74_9APIC|nr:bifunctional Nucleotidyltransferase superfamily/TUTase nucleotidyltransferase domain [Babesia duncani]